jgi:hypothetical protein
MKTQSVHKIDEARRPVSRRPTERTGGIATRSHVINLATESDSRRGVASRESSRRSAHSARRSDESSEPGQESLDLPPPSVATERATVLCAVCSGPPVWRNQLHTSTGQFSIQSVRLVGVVANETFRERTDKPLCEGRMHQRGIAGARFDTTDSGPGGPPTRGPGPQNPRMPLSTARFSFRTKTSTNPL